MKFNEHSQLKAATTHAFLSPSGYHWLNYDIPKLLAVYENNKAKERGTRLHAFASEAISLNVKLSRSPLTLNQYVNDAIGFHMTPEQPLYYSVYCWGTADAISFTGKHLRIHDLKTGNTPASMKQLYVYAALFCLEYDKDPAQIDIDLRIYQNSEIVEDKPTPEDIRNIMETIKLFSKELEAYEKENPDV